MCGDGCGTAGSHCCGCGHFSLFLELRVPVSFHGLMSLSETSIIGFASEIFATNRLIREALTF